VRVELEAKGATDWAKLEALPEQVGAARLGLAILLLVGIRPLQNVGGMARAASARIHPGR